MILPRSPSNAPFAVCERHVVVRFKPAFRYAWIR